MYDVIAAVIAGICAIYAVYLQYRLGEKSTSFADIDDSSFKVLSDLRSPDDVWKGYTKDWKSYNDSWVLEIETPDVYVDTHVKRYNDENCADFKFLFFLKNDIGQFERFVKFQSLVHLGLGEKEIKSDYFVTALLSRIELGPLPDTLDHIEVFLNTRDNPPNQTFFRGHEILKKGEKPKKVSLWYLSLDSNPEAPHLILKTNNGRFWQTLDNKWNTMRVGAEKVAGKEIFRKYLSLVANLA